MSDLANYGLQILRATFTPLFYLTHDSYTVDINMSTALKWTAEQSRFYTQTIVTLAYSNWQSVLSINALNPSTSDLALGVCYISLVTPIAGLF
jgi:hypothetical protein